MNSTSQQQQASAPVHNPERGAKVIARAVELMRLGQSKGWSHALALANAEIR